MSDRKSAQPTERHRRMARRWLRLSAPLTDRETPLANLLATIERDTLERAARMCERRMPRPDDGGDELAEWYAETLHDLAAGIRAIIEAPEEER